MLPPELGAGGAVANGDVEIGLTQIAEILPYAGAELLGPLPAEIQLNTDFASGVGTSAKEAAGANALIKFLATPAAGYAGCSHAIPKINLTARLKEIKCPILVIVGEQDPGTPLAMAREIHDNAPGSKLVVLPQEFGRPFIAPPGIPADRLEILRKAFIEMCNDADFHKDAATAGEPVGAPIPAPELEKVIARLAEAATPEVISEYRRLGQAK
jgi:pimeloyl-ACP methyl ester carboxylesterase